MRKRKLGLLLPLLCLSACSLSPVRYDSDLVDMDIKYVDGYYYVSVEGKNFQVGVKHTKIVVSNDDEVVLIDYPYGEDELIFYTTLNYGGN